MFAVPGWQIRAESLVTEKPSAKSGKIKADARLSSKRKRSQSEGEDAHLLDANGLDKLWRQRSSQELHKGDLTLPTKRKADAGPGRSASPSRGNTAHTSKAKEGAQTPQSSDNRPMAENKLSRKQKKLLNKKQREDQASGNPASVAAQAEGISTKSKPTSKRDKKHAQQQSDQGHVVQHKHGKPMSKSTDSAPQANSVPEREGVLQDLKPYHFSGHAGACASPVNCAQAASGAKPSAPRRSSPPPPGSSTVKAASTKISKLTPLQSKFAAKLTSARFRHLNQQLYTTSSTDSLQLFKSQPSLFTEYHLGFTQQTQSWPVNPVQTLIAALQSRPDLPRRKTGSCTIADLGCGDAPLARALAKGKAGKKLGLKIHSFDLHAVNEHVTVADIASLPLRDGEADIAIFCLALMGTNWLDFVEECWRILRGDGKGEVWVAEVKSRFVNQPGRRLPGQAVDNSVGKKRRRITQKSHEDTGDGIAHGDDGVILEDDADSASTTTNAFSSFVSVFERRGFKLKEGSIDNANKMFVSMVFYKSGVPVAGRYKGLKWNGKEYQSQSQTQQHGKMRAARTDDNDDVDPKDEAAVLKPCVYKTR